MIERRRPLQHPHSAQQGGQKVRVHRETSQGQPVRGFVSQVVSLVPAAHDVGRRAAAGKEENRLCRQSAQKVAQPLLKVVKAIEAAADLDDDGAGRWHGSFVPSKLRG